MYAVNRNFGKSTVKNRKKLRYFNTHHSARTGYYCKRFILCIETIYLIRFSDKMANQTDTMVSLTMVARELPMSKISSSELLLEDSVLGAPLTESRTALPFELLP